MIRTLPGMVRAARGGSSMGRKTIPQGAATSVYCALVDGIAGGKYVPTLFI